MKELADKVRAATEDLQRAVNEAEDAGLDVELTVNVFRFFHRQTGKTEIAASVTKPVEEL